VRLPSSINLKRATSLAGLVPPEPSDALLRAQANDRRAQRHSRGPNAVRLSPAPERFSSVASRTRSPLEFLASITDWGRPETALDSSEPRTNARYGVPLATLSMEGRSAVGGGARGCAASTSQHGPSPHGEAGSSRSAVGVGAAHRRPPTLPFTPTRTAEQGELPQAHGAPVTERSLSSAAASGASQPGLLLTRPSREWVRRQAAMDAERASVPEPRSSSGMPICRTVPANSDERASIWVKSRPTPSPPRTMPAIGVPWLQQPAVPAARFLERILA